jgi:hypothetical protein
MISHNWFAGANTGGECAAAIYSLNGIDPKAYEHRASGNARRTYGGLLH